MPPHSPPPPIYFLVFLENLGYMLKGIPNPQLDTAFYFYIVGKFGLSLT